MKCAVYARLSTSDQTCETQLLELRRYVEARGWATREEYVDAGVSGARESRPALDRLVKDAKRRRFDVVVVWRLDRLGRNLRHLILLLDDLQGTGVAFVSLSEGSTQQHLLDGCSCTSSGRLQNLNEPASLSGCGSGGYLSIRKDIREMASFPAGCWPFVFVDVIGSRWKWGLASSCRSSRRSRPTRHRTRKRPAQLLALFENGSHPPGHRVDELGPVAPRLTLRDV